jgi:hypothetical protein
MRCCTSSGIVTSEYPGGIEERLELVSVPFVPIAGIASFCPRAAVVACAGLADFDECPGMGMGMSMSGIGCSGGSGLA